MTVETTQSHTGDGNERVDWALLKSSSLLSVGTVLARVLGMAFSLVLARAFTPDDYGSIRFMITLALLISVFTQPFGQHVFARFVGMTKAEPGRLTLALPNLWAIAGTLLVATLVISVPVLAALGRLNIGVISMIVGMAIFHTYWGFCRGLAAERRIVAVSVGSNVVQLVAVLVAIYAFDLRSTVLVTSIFGLSYLLPVVVGHHRSGTKISLRRSQINRESVREIVRFSVPIWASHAAYVGYNSAVVLLLERYVGTAAVGVYALANTLGRSFLFLPEAVATLLMPKIAGQMAAKDSSAGSGGLGALQGATLAANLVGLLIYVVVVERFVTFGFGETYFEDGVWPYLFMAVAMIALGQHSSLTAVLVGRGEARFEVVSRVAGLAVTVLVGFLLIPDSGPIGAAAAMLAGAATSLAYYGTLMLRGLGFGET